MIIFPQSKSPTLMVSHNNNINDNVFSEERLQWWSILREKSSMIGFYLWTQINDYFFLIKTHQRWFFLVNNGKRFLRETSRKIFFSSRKGNQWLSLHREKTISDDFFSEKSIQRWTGREKIYNDDLFSEKIVNNDYFSEKSHQQNFFS